MRTNLSKWTCAYSDFPWPMSADLFPASEDVLSYLDSYASNFQLFPFIRFNTEVREIQKKEYGFRILTSDGNVEHFDKVIVASGVFSKPSYPAGFDMESPQIPFTHSSDIDGIGDVSDLEISVVGASFSGIEVSQLLLERGCRKVNLVFNHPTWIIPRRVIDDKSGHEIPIDFLFYKREMGNSVDAEEKNRRVFDYFTQRFGNPGDYHSTLKIERDGAPNFVAISDRFLEYVEMGRVDPIRGRFSRLLDNYVILGDDQKIHSDAVVFCTGYECNLDFLSEEIRSLIEYEPQDKFLPFIASRSTYNPNVNGVYFVGVYRGPYFGVMELQARWAVSHMTGVDRKFKLADDAKLAEERSKRLTQPKPQFPHGDYVSFCDELAIDIGAFPTRKVASDLLELIEQGPVVPAHYRVLEEMDEIGEFGNLIRRINHIRERS